MWIESNVIKKKRCDRTDLCQEIIESQHNINKLLDYLDAGNKLKLPEMFIKDITDTKKQKETRKLNSGHINQAWRYGGKIILISDCKGTQRVTDTDIEQKLIAIVEWIKQEIERL